LLLQVLVMVNSWICLHSWLIRPLFSAQKQQFNVEIIAVWHVLLLQVLVYGEQLDLSPFMADQAMDEGPATYTLSGVIVHLDQVGLCLLHVLCLQCKPGRFMFATYVC
jgi:hypothetical protein